MALHLPDENISTAELEAVVEASADLMFKVSEAGRILSCRIGKFADPIWHPEELLGKNLANTILGTDPVSFTKAIRHVVEERDTQKMEYFVHVPNLDKWYEVRMVPSDNHEVLAVFKDITSQKQALTDKKHSEVLFKAIFDNTYQFTALLSPKGTLLHINQTALNFSGIEIDEIQGIPFWEAPWWKVPNSHSLRLKAAIRSAAANNFVRYETQVLGADNNIYCLDFSLKPILDEERNVIFLIAEGRDITDRIKMEQELARSQKMYRAVAQNIPRGMLFIINKELVFTMAEGELLEMVNLSKEAVEGKTLNDLPLNDELYALFYKNYLAGLEGKSGKFEYQSEQGQFYYTIIVQPLIQPNKEIEEVLIIVYDIFEQKKMALQLQQNLQQIQENVKVLQQKNDQLEQFAYISSHDLQEPLRMVVSYTQLLERKFARRIDPEAKEFIAYAREGAQRMQQIIYDLLLYNDLDNNSRYLQTINANMALKTATYKLQPQIEATSAQITSDTLPEVMVDAKEFLILLEHLLLNAIKFAKPQNAPFIHVSATDNHTEWIFSVKDNGIGIQENHYNRIFNIFQRLHGRKEYNGSGIGLAICKKIVNLHGGNIWVESSEQGSTFYFSLPKPMFM